MTRHRWTYAAAIPVLTAWALAPWAMAQNERPTPSTTPPAGQAQAQSQAKPSAKRPSARAVAAALAGDLSPAQAQKLADEIIAGLGAKALAEGQVGAITEGPAVMMAVVSGQPAIVRRADGQPGPALRRLGQGGLQVFAGELPSGTAFEFVYATAPGADKPTVRIGPAEGKAHRLEHFPLGPDSQARANVPRGRLTQHRFEASRVFPGTTRDYWVYVPAQYKLGTVAAVMVFQDGSWYADANGAYRVPVVFDNLLAAGDMPVTVGVFVNPGEIPAATPPEAGQPRPRPRPNRSFEYDTLSDDYARFLIDELLPEVERVAGVKLSGDPAARAVAGISSGGICAFTVAWERPDSFGKVLSHVGSFTNIRGGDVYPGRIRKTQPKPIRVYLQAGRNDLDNVHGHWPLANLAMEAALRWAKYDYHFVMGDGFHGSRHGAAILPESLRWLWRDWKTHPATAGLTPGPANAGDQ